MQSKRLMRVIVDRLTVALVLAHVLNAACGGNAATRPPVGTGGGPGTSGIGGDAPGATTGAAGRGSAGAAGGGNSPTGTGGGASGSAGARGRGCPPGGHGAARGAPRPG